MIRYQRFRAAVYTYICRKGKRPFFHKITDLRDSDLGSLLDSIIEGVELCLGKVGLFEEGGSDRPVSEELVSVEAASQASLVQRIAFGERAGQRVRKIGLRQEGEVMESKGPQYMASRQDAWFVQHGLLEGLHHNENDHISLILMTI